MKTFSLFLSLFIIASCSTPTAYVLSKGDKDGYSDRTIDNTLKVSTFKGNSSSTKADAELYAKFRAIEICHELGNKYAHIMVVKDKTFSKEVSQTTATSPSMYYGMSPYYGGMGPGWGMNIGTTSYSTTNETYTYPIFEAYFECTDRPLDARVSLYDLSPSQTKEFVNDLLGAVQVKEVLKDSPNSKKIVKGDIILKAGGERVATVLDVYRISRRHIQKNLTIDYIHDGKRKKTSVSFADVTSLVAAAQSEIIKEACQKPTIKEKNNLCK